MDVLPAAVVGLTCTAIMASSTRPLLRRLPEPRDQPDGEHKTPYAEVGSWTFVVVVAITSGLLVGYAATRVPPAAVPQWVVLGTAALLLAAIDARTTWLPLTLTRATWALSLAAAVVGAAIAGPSWPDSVLRTAVGATVAALLFGTVWWVSRGGLGFGDVRYAPLVGAAAGAAGWTSIWTGLLLGAITGGLWGLVRVIRRRPGPFPYAPSMFAGAWLALVGGFS